MDLGIKGKTALVAASSQGLGLAAALSLAGEGANIALCSRNRTSVEKVAVEIRKKTGVVVEAFEADVSDAGAIDNLITSVTGRFGTIDILVNNAGGPPTGTLSTISDSEWERGFQLTMMSAIRLTRAVLPMMQQSKWGRVITIVSIAAKEPINDLLVSSTLRPGILGMTKILANQFGKDNITVNTVCPGYIQTERQDELSRSRSESSGISKEEYLALRAKDIPAGRLGRPDELGDVIAFLASARASFINGANILVDGGQAKGIF